MDRHLTQGSIQKSDTLVLPEGYIAVISPDGHQYIVPQFLIPATHQIFEAYWTKLDFGVAQADGGVSTQTLDRNHMLCIATLAMN